MDKYNTKKFLEFSSFKSVEGYGNQDLETTGVREAP